MEPTYLWILNYSYGGTMVIKLTKEQKRQSDEYESFEEYIRDNLEEEYNFNLDDCQWMVTNQYQYEKVGF